MKHNKHFKQTDNASYIQTIRKDNYPINNINKKSKPKRHRQDVHADQKNILIGLFFTVLLLGQSLIKVQAKIARYSHARRNEKKFEMEDNQNENSRQLSKSTGSFLSHALKHDNKNAAKSSSYNMIVDAGSSGSRLHLFKIDEQDGSIKDVYSEKIKPGLSFFANNTSAAGASFKPLLDNANQYLSHHNISQHDVSLRILATAGMRLLPEETQKHIYNNVENYIKTNYLFNLDEVRTIPGELEGAYSWININYLAHRASEDNKTLGVIDIGGGSIQVAYPLNNDNSEAQPQLNIISHLGLGLDQARQKINFHSLAGACYPKGYPLTETVTGNYNFTRCSMLYSDFIDTHTNGTESLKLPNIPFIAHSGAYYIYQFFGLDKLVEKQHSEDIIRAACDTPWEQMKQQHPSIDNRYLPIYCADGTYVHTLFHEKHQLQDQQVQVTNQVDGQEVDWTLGALLHKMR